MAGAKHESGLRVVLMGGGKAPNGAACARQPARGVPVAWRLGGVLPTAVRGRVVQPLAGGEAAMARVAWVASGMAWARDRCWGRRRRLGSGSDEMTHLLVSKEF